MIEKVKRQPTLKSLLLQLKEPDDSFVIERSKLDSLRTIASREKIGISTEPCVLLLDAGGRIPGEHLRVWRKFSDLENVKRIEDEGVRLQEEYEDLRTEL